MCCKVNREGKLNKRKCYKVYDKIMEKEKIKKRGNVYKWNWRNIGCYWKWRI